MHSFYYTSESVNIRNFVYYYFMFNKLKGNNNLPRSVMGVAGWLLKRGVICVCDQLILIGYFPNPVSDSFLYQGSETYKGV